MNKKYCIVSDTYYIKNYIRPFNIKYNFYGASLDHPQMNLDFEIEFTDEFFKHIRFYEVFFNKKGQPISVFHLGKEEHSDDLPNGWLSLNEFFEKSNYHFSLFNSTDQWYDDNSELYIALLRWGKEVAEQRIRESIVDSVENEEDKN